MKLLVHKFYLIIILLPGSFSSLWAQCAEQADIWQNTWQSCQTAANPHSIRGEGHWIMYDFGTVYKLSTTRIWNSNEPGTLDMGFKDVTIDYSLDGINWKELGKFQFERGTGQAIYGGAPGPDFNGKQARYVVISAQSNWGDASCYGMAEVKFNLFPDPGSFLVTALEDNPFGEDLRASLYPNPAREGTNLQFTSSRKGEVAIKIFSVMGSLLDIQEQEVQLGENKLEVDTQDLSDGIYIIWVSQTGSNKPLFTGRLVIAGN